MSNPSNYGLDAKVFFRHDVSTDQYSMVLKFPRDEFIIDCCVHMFEDFMKHYPSVTLVKVIPSSVSDDKKAEIVSDIINNALNKKL